VVAVLVVQVAYQALQETEHKDQILYCLVLLHFQQSHLLAEDMVVAEKHLEQLLMVGVVLEVLEAVAVEMFLEEPQADLAHQAKEITVVLAQTLLLDLRVVEVVLELQAVMVVDQLLVVVVQEHLLHTQELQQHMLVAVVEVDQHLDLLQVLAEVLVVAVEVVTQLQDLLELQTQVAVAVVVDILVVQVELLEALAVQV
jgi:hypothetical protein